MVEFVQKGPRMDLQKKPGIAGHRLDRGAPAWASPRSMMTGRSILETLSALIKTRDDRAGFAGGRRLWRSMLIVAPLPDADPGATLRSRLTGFAGFLRANGFGVGGGVRRACSSGRAGRNIRCGDSALELQGTAVRPWRRMAPIRSPFDAYFRQTRRPSPEAAT
jgi:hypothetical protein